MSSLNETTPANKNASEIMLERLITMLTARKNNFDALFYKTDRPVDLDRNLYVYLSDDQAKCPSFCIPFQEFLSLIRNNMVSLEDLLKDPETAVDNFTCEEEINHVSNVDRFTIQLLTHIPFRLVLRNLNYDIYFVCDRSSVVKYVPDMYYIIDPEIHVLTHFSGDSFDLLDRSEIEDELFRFKNGFICSYIEFDEDNYYEFQKYCVNNLMLLYEAVEKSCFNVISDALLEYQMVYTAYIYDGTKYYHKNKRYCEQYVSIYTCSNKFSTILDYVDARYPRTESLINRFRKFDTDSEDSSEDEMSEEESFEEELSSEESSSETSYDLSSSVYE